ncbi:hypothetical protein GQ43DRAFT_471606 [Delitschia confertaspora ATCC 74209]|uniref:Uncharacterized protein n=1 Tax=Delitschia confertaspora ATCC 74209 TaxID=1513339 RepID=A0A9P4MT34_9PLEO|nr:hypothetical protein GQ43DRAFT_471606 [Delitschia confertaspora ATCC 74209]
MPVISHPLSPRMDSRTMSSQAPRRPTLHGRQFSSGTAASLRLPSLPRFHPANFPSSQSSSVAGTPATGPSSPQPPLSPRTYHKQYSEAQRQMLMLNRDFLSPGSARSNRTSTPRPTSPRLCPTGSPGPVTPLELEGAGGYLAVGINPNDAASHVDKLIRNEAQRRGELSPKRTISSGGR